MNGDLKNSVYSGNAIYSDCWGNETYLAKPQIYIWKKHLCPFHLTFEGLLVEWFVTSAVPKVTGLSVLYLNFICFTSGEIDMQTVSVSMELKMKKLLSLSSCFRLENYREKERLSVEFRQSCDILGNIVKLLWSVQSLYCIPHLLTSSLHPLCFFSFFLSQDRFHTSLK